MKTLLTLFILFFSSSMLAEDISDFEIEGMSIEDSLLQFYSKSEINNAPNYNDLPSDMKFTIIEMPAKGKYEMFQFFYKTNDNNYTITSIGGAIFMNVNKCTKEQKKMNENISSTMNNAKVYGPEKYAHPDDPSGDSYSVRYSINFEGGNALIECYHFSNQVQWEDHMRISILNNQTKKWIDSNYGLN